MVVIQTERFTIHQFFIPRDEKLGEGRDYYVAMFRDEDVPRPVCEVVVWNNYLEWVHVCETMRRQGIATEVILAIEAHIGSILVKEGVTETGIQLCKSFENNTDEPDLIPFKRPPLVVPKYCTYVRLQGILGWLCGWSLVEISDQELDSELTSQYIDEFAQLGIKVLLLEMESPPQKFYFVPKGSKIKGWGTMSKGYA